MKNQIIKALKIVGNVLFYSVLLLLLAFSFSNITRKTDADIPNLFGKGFISILSGSMDGTKEDSFPKGSVVFIDILNEESKSKLEVNDIVVFYDSTLKIHIIHRIVAINDDIITTQGDVNAEKYGTFDGTNYNENMQLESNQNKYIIGKYTSNIKGVGEFFEYVKSSNGFLIIIVLPLVVLFGFELVKLIRYILKHNRQKLEAKHEKDLQRIKEEMMQEILKKQSEENKDK